MAKATMEENKLLAKQKKDTDAYDWQIDLAFDKYTTECD